MKEHLSYYIISLVLAMTAASACAQQKDSSQLLLPVTISGAARRDAFGTTLPSQSLDRRTLTQLNTPSVADAAKYFSGVLVKDYGGAGGLKTVSVRSLGATHTGVQYDGVVVSDAQTGQVDLGQYSSSFLHALDLYQANTAYTPAPARSFASGSLLSMQSNAFSPSTMKKQFFAGLRQGSFGLWQPHAGVAIPLSRSMSADLTSELTHSRGNYPIFIHNGVLSHSAKRTNTDLDSWQSEANVLKQFGDSSTLQLKFFNYHSERGLPGSVALYNQQSHQRLLNSDRFIQARYRADLDSRYTLLVSAKHNYSYTKYTDPDYQNNAGGLDNRYRQQESYVSIAASRSSSWLNVAIASDLSYSKLRSNMLNFVSPERTATWNNLSIDHIDPNWKLNASLLLTNITDHTSGVGARVSNTRLTPTFSANFTPSGKSPFLIRTFYKEVFRMPTFNDLYYALVGNRNLRPEYARQVNAGVVYQQESRTALQSIRVSLDGYFNAVDDKIVAVPSQNLFSWTMLNVGKVHIAGIDLTTELNGRLSQSITWFARVAGTLQKATDVTDRNTSSYNDRIPYTPDYSGSGLISLSWRKWNTGTSMVFSGTRYSLGDNSAFTRMKGWSAIDLFIARTLGFNACSMNVRAEIDNTGDQQYDIVRSYPMPQRSYKISLIILNKSINK